ncbi:MAG: GNAT family N-acetyltransferase [Salinarimonas sp.]
MHAGHSNRYQIRVAACRSDLERAQALRYRAFFENRPGTCPRPDRLDHDEFDPACHHVLIEEEASGDLVCCFRLLPLRDGGEIERSYTAQFYDLSALHAYCDPMLELGRFCIRPGWRDPAIMRLAWAALARLVDETGARMLFGCSSFTGAAPEPHSPALALLASRHLAPRRWQPRIKAPQVMTLAEMLPAHDLDDRRALAALPTLLRGYLALGAWVSDHAVLDQELDTLHVFTGLEISRVPPLKARRLRASANAAMADKPVLARSLTARTAPCSAYASHAKPRAGPAPRGVR